MFFHSVGSAQKTALGQTFLRSQTKFTMILNLQCLDSYDIPQTLVVNALMKCYAWNLKLTSPLSYLSFCSYMLVFEKSENMFPGLLIGLAYMQRLHAT